MLALTETFAIFAFIYGYTNFSLSNFISRFTGLLCLIISIIIVYLHVFAWGDNLFSHGPFESLNIEEGKKAIFGQFLFIPISMFFFTSEKSFFIASVLISLICYLQHRENIKRLLNGSEAKF